MADKYPSIICLKCGERNTGVSPFCFSCGTRLTNSEADESAEIYQSDFGEAANAAPSAATSDWENKEPTIEAKANESENVGAAIGAANESSLSSIDGIKSPIENAVLEPQATEQVGKAKIQMPAPAVQSVEQIRINDGTKGSLGFSSKALAMRIVVLALSLIVALTFFAPFVSVQSDIEDYDKVTTSFSPYELVCFAIDSFYSYGENSIVYTDEAIELDYLDGIIEKYLELDSHSDTPKELISRYFKLAFSLNLMSRGSTAKVSLIVSAVLWLVYALFAVLAVIFSTIELIRPPLSKKTHSPLVTRLGGKMLLYSVITLPIYIVISAHACQISRLSGIFGGCGVGMGIGAYVLLAIALVTAGYAIFCAIRHTASRARDGQTRLVNRKTVAIFISLFAAIFVTAPAFSISFAGISQSGKVEEKTYTSSIFDRSDLSNEDLRYFHNLNSFTDEQAIVDLSNSAAVGEDIGEDISAIFYNRILVGIGVEADLFYMAFTALFALISIFGALTLRRSIQHVLDEKCRKGRAPAVFLTIFAFINLALGAVFIVLANSSLTYAMGSHISFGITASPIVLAVLALASAIAIRSKHPEPKVEYDNPDVSFTSYVQ